MTRDLVVVAWCDLDHDGLQIVATPHLVEIDGLRREIDLCEEHGKVLDVVQAFLALAGREPDQPKRKPRRSRRAVPADQGFVCPDCGQAFATPQGRGAHRFRAHGYRRPPKTS